MSWIIVGDSDYATFACDTGMESFGPLHAEYKASNDAKESLREFAETLGTDPRKLHNHEKLREKYVEWKKSIRA